jgi:hypothetical protein
MAAGQALQSKLFFLDTETYVRRNFSFETGALKQLQDHLTEDDCLLLITDINIREIRRHLRRKANEAASIIKETKKTAMILRNTPNLAHHRIFDELSADQIYVELSSNFDKFLANKNIEQISTATVSIPDVFDAYFDERPPFASSGKKSEFPDAFILSAVNSISLLRGHSLYVVSNDNDVKAFCTGRENLISIDRVEELLGLIVANADRLAEPSKLAEEIYVELQPVIEERVQNELKTADFDFRIDMLEAEISTLDIHDVEYLSKTLTDASAEQSTFELMTRISVDVEFAYPDFDRSPWDSEDKEHPFLFYNYETRRYTRTAPVEIIISFEDGIAANAEVESVDLEAISNLKSAKFETLEHREEYFEVGDE